MEDTTNTSILLYIRKYTTGEELLRLSDAGKGGRYLLTTESPRRDGRRFALKLRERLIVRCIPPIPPREPRSDQLPIQ